MISWFEGVGARAVKAAVSWSGGKESCSACYRVILAGLEVTHLLNFLVKDRPPYHGSPAILRAQSKAVGIPMIQREVTWDTYAGGFKSAITLLKRVGVEGVVFGDIYLQEHKTWLERLCRELGVKTYFPLWLEEPEELLRSFIRQGFEAIASSVDSSRLGREWLGRKVDENFVEGLKRTKPSIDLCGEMGEYHTLVTDGPIFKERIEIGEREEMLRDGYWLVNVLRCETVTKHLLS